jgi:hypothetical protein
MDQLRNAVALKVESITAEIARINREAAVRAEVAREIDDFVRTLNQQHPSGRLDAVDRSAISGLTPFLVPAVEGVRKAAAVPPRLPW